MPLSAVPLESSTAPEEPALAASAVTRLMAPEEEEMPEPVAIVTKPPDAPTAG